MHEIKDANLGRDLRDSGMHESDVGALHGEIGKQEN
jgi:hypothetical protein